MSMQLVAERHTPLPVSAEAAFAFLASPGSPERLWPPWLRSELLAPEPPFQAGSRYLRRIHAGPFTIDVAVELRDVVPERGFSTVLASGPFDRWSHRVELAPAGGACVLSDSIECHVPAGFRLGRARLARGLVRLLAHRHRVAAGDLALHAAVAGLPRQHVALTGASGFVGSTLIPLLTSGGHRVTRLVRRAPRPGELRWDPAGGLDPAGLRGITAVIHLAGENIGVRWTGPRRRRIRESRLAGTRQLAEAIAQAEDGPRTLLSASAIGYYGDRGDETLSETSPPGRGFLPELCVAWEAATDPAARAGVRVACLRTGLPLSPEGGVLQRMLPFFRVGAGGRLGSGRQWMSWVASDDLIGAYYLALMHDIQGPVNAVSPAPVRNAELTRLLGRVLRRPALLAVPRTALRLRFGRMADEAILASARVHPDALQAAGFAFRFPELESALRHALGREPPA